MSLGFSANASPGRKPALASVAKKAACRGASGTQHLRAGPYLAPVLPDVDGPVHRLHRGVEEERRLVDRLDLLRGARRARAGRRPASAPSRPASIHASPPTCGRPRRRRRRRAARSAARPGPPRCRRPCRPGRDSSRLSEHYQGLVERHDLEVDDPEDREACEQCRQHDRETAFHRDFLLPLRRGPGLDGSRPSKSCREPAQLRDARSFYNPQGGVPAIGGTDRSMLMLRLPRLRRSRAELRCVRDAKSHAPATSRSLAAIR